MASGRGAAGGATAGATVGSFFPPYGAPIGAGIGALLGLFGGETDRTLSPEVAALFRRETERQRQLRPMIDAISRLAFARLPGDARAGYQSVSPEEAGRWADVISPASGDDDDYAQRPEVRQLLREQLIRLRMADPIIQAVTRMAGMRMPRGYRVDVTRKPPQYG